MDENKFDQQQQPGSNQGPPPGYNQQQPPPGYNQQQPPPGYQQGQQGYQGPPPGYYQQQPPPGYGQQPPPGYYQQPPPGYGQPLPNYQVGFLEAYVSYWKNYFNFNDRTSRAGYWWVVLMNIIIEAVVGTVIGVTSAVAVPAMQYYSGYDPFAFAVPFVGVGIIYYIWNIANIIPGISICVRRLHDIGRSGLWVLIAFVPIVGWIILIVFMATAQKFPPENRYAYLRQV